MMAKELISNLENDEDDYYNFFTIMPTYVHMYDILTNRKSNLRFLFNIKGEQIYISHLLGNLYALNSYIDRDIESDEYKKHNINLVSLDSFSFTYILIFALEWMYDKLSDYYFVKYIKLFEFFYIQSMLCHRSIWSAQDHIKHVYDETFKRNENLNLEINFLIFQRKLFEKSSGKFYCCENSSVVESDEFVHPVMVKNHNHIYFDQFDERQRLLKVISLSTIKNKIDPENFMKILLSNEFNVEHLNNMSEKKKSSNTYWNDEKSIDEYINEQIMIDSYGSLFIIPRKLNQLLGNNNVLGKKEIIQTYLQNEVSDWPTLYLVDKMFRFINHGFGIFDILLRSYEEIKHFFDFYLSQVEYIFDSNVNMELKICKLYKVEINEETLNKIKNS